VKGKNYIAGKWIRAKGGKEYESRNPAKYGEILGRVPLSHREEVEQAVASAREAFPTWRAISRIKRGECIERFVDVVKGEADEIARLVAKEAGKAINEARAALAAELQPIDDVRSTAAYRARVAANLLEEFLRSLA